MRLIGNWLYTTSADIRFLFRVSSQMYFQCTFNRKWFGAHPKGFCVVFTPNCACNKLQPGFSEASTGSSNLTRTSKIPIWSSFFSSLSDSSDVFVFVTECKTVITSASKVPVLSLSCSHLVNILKIYQMNWKGPNNKLEKNHNSFVYFFIFTIWHPSSINPTLINGPIFLIQFIISSCHK